MDKTWKAVERCLAGRLGGQQVGATGHSTADVLTDWLAVEVKTQKVSPGWLLSAVEQAVGAAGEAGGCGGSKRKVPVSELSSRHE